MLNALLLSLTNHAARAIPLAVAAALAAEATAQNLVPNPSFEDTVNCEIPTQCTLLKAAHWSNPTLSTPDMWDADTARLCGYDILALGMGVILPVDGSRMAGEYLWDGPLGGDSREYIMAQLTEALTHGIEYEVSLWYMRNPAFGSAVNHVGVWLGNDSALQTTIGPMNLVPTLKLHDPNNPYLANSSEWTQLADTIIATGGERWLVIGNFDAQDSVNAIVADPFAPYSNAYYFMDNVSVRAIQGTGIVSFAKPTVWWDGSLLVLSSKDMNGRVTLEIVDAAGRLLHQTSVNFMDGRAIISMNRFTAGMYLLRLSSAKATVVARMVKEGGVW